MNYREIVDKAVRELEEDGFISREDDLITISEKGLDEVQRFGDNNLKMFSLIMLYAVLMKQEKVI